MTDLLKLYFKDIENYLPLSKEEEHAIALEYYKTKDKELELKLLKHNLRSVIYLAKKYRYFNDDSFIDFLQEGNEGLLRAIRKFDPNAGVRVITFAKKYIIAKFCDYLETRENLIRRVSSKLQKRIFYKLCKLKKFKLNLSEIEEIAAEFDTTIDIVRELTEKLSTEISDDFTNIYDKNSSPEDILEKLEYENSVLNVYENLNCLDTRSRDIIVSRYIDKVTLATLASKYNVSLQRIEQLEKKALKKMVAMNAN